MLTFKEYTEKYYKVFPTNPLTNPNKDKNKKKIENDSMNGSQGTVVDIAPGVGTGDDGRYIEFDA